MGAQASTQQCGSVTRTWLSIAAASIDDHRVATCQWVMGDHNRKDSKTQLYISNLPSGATSKRLEDAFASFGEITDAFIPHRGSRFGFVDFKDPDAASRALAGMKDVPLDEIAAKLHPTEFIGVIRAKERPPQKERKPPAEKKEKAE